MCTHSQYKKNKSVRTKCAHNCNLFVFVIVVVAAFFYFSRFASSVDIQFRYKETFAITPMANKINGDFFLQFCIERYSYNYCSEVSLQTYFINCPLLSVRFAIIMFYCGTPSLLNTWEKNNEKNTLNRTIPLEHWNKIRWIECRNWVETGISPTLIRQLHSFWISVNGCQTIQIRKKSKCQILMPKRKQKWKINENVECLILKSWLIFNEKKINSFSC